MTPSLTHVNGTPVAMPVMGDWQPIETDRTAIVWERKLRPAPDQIEEPEVPTEPARDLLAEAEAEAIRSRARADAEARRVAADAEADAVRIKAEAEAEKQRIANERAARRLALENAELDAKIADANRRRDEAARAATAARTADETAAKADAEQHAEVEKATSRWRIYALSFYIVCAIVALPVQVAAFWSPRAPWLIVAPLMLEGGAWVVLKGAAAAVASHRPHWHYRLIAWLLAFIASGINLWHGMHAFDVATAIGTAFASLAGPGVWDLHEHGRIRVRDGKLTRAQRRAVKAEGKRQAAEKAAADVRAKAEREAAEAAAVEAAAQLAGHRAEAYPKEWAHALKLASALGATSVTELVWERAWDDLHAAKPGVTVDAIRTRNVAAKRLAVARSEGPDSTPSKVTNAQRVPQVSAVSGRGAKGGPKVRGVRRPGDTRPFVNAAKKQASIAAKTTTRDDTKDA